MSFDKLAWQRQQRREFARSHGYSTAANYATDGLREKVLERDGRKCVKCGMTDEEHKAKWGRPITVDHKDKNHAHNTFDNLQTLCLVCHGRKDLISRLRERKGPKHKDRIIELKSRGMTYREIASEVGLSVATVYCWWQFWRKGLYEHTGN